MRVVIADDEDLIREGLRELVDWEQLGFTVVGMAEDGEEALEIVEDTVPHLLITDIKMPFLDGLELIAATRERYPKVRAVLVTGHDEFEYAKEAIELHAQAYLLKPIEPERLVKTLSKIRDEFDKEQAQNAELKQLRRAASASRPADSAVTLDNLIRDRLSVSAREDLFKRLGIGGGQVYASLLLWSQREKGSHIELHQISVCSNQSVTWELTEGLLRDEGTALVPRLITLLWSEDSGELKRCVSVAEELARGKGIGLSSSGVRPIRAGLNRALEECKRTLSYVLHTGGPAVTRFENIPEVGRWKKGQLPTPRKLSEVARAADKTSFEALLRQIEQAVSDVGNKDLPVLEALINHLLVGTYEELSPLVDPNWDLAERVSTVQGAPHLREKVAHVIDGLRALFDAAAESLRRGSDRRIEEAAEFIRSHYQHPGLSLEDVSKACNMSPGHLSTTFKRKHGLNFVEYLTTVRMESAKRALASSDLPTYVVAEKVGYDNPTYFSTAFKRYEGLTPTEYRRKHRS